MTCVATKLGVQFNPPTIRVLYRDSSTGRDRVRSMPVRGLRLDSDARAIATDLLQRHAQVLKGTSVDQLTRLIRRLQDNKFDLNKVSQEELDLAKKNMDDMFSRNKVGPGHPDFQYDVRKEFVPSEDNEWDEDLEDDEDEGDQNNINTFKTEAAVVKPVAQPAPSTREKSPEVAEEVEVEEVYEYEQDHEEVDEEELEEKDQEEEEAPEREHEDEDDHEDEDGGEESAEDEEEEAVPARSSLQRPQEKPLPSRQEPEEESDVDEIEEIIEEIYDDDNDVIEADHVASEEDDDSGF